MTLKLPNVTLTLIETREHVLAKLALLDCLEKAEFGEIIVFTDQPLRFAIPGVTTVQVSDWPEKVGWSRCFWYEVAQHVRTSHILSIQWDSWIVDPGCWTDEFLEYDWIGAPWWYKDGMNVGNGGFSLRSTKFARFIRNNRADYPCTTALDDDLYCRKYRPRLEVAGFVWAPESLAHRFSFECVRPGPTAKHFGFHATFNFDYGCEGNEARLLERASLMARSSYIYGHSVLWDNFAKKFPKVVEQLKESEDGKYSGISREGNAGLGARWSGGDSADE